jgi:Ca2+-binding RTX toxin-like protein
MTGSYGQLLTGKGADIVTVNGFQTSIDTGSEDDQISLDGYGNTLAAQQGNDSAVVKGLNNTVDMGDGNDFLRIIASLTTVQMGNGNDTVIIEDGSDNHVDAGAGNDTVIGSAQNDFIMGGTGADDLTGRQGSDFLDGGLGNDIYRFSQGDGQDLVTDAGGTDRIVFDSSVSKSSFALFKSASGDLQVGYGQGDVITIQNFSQSANQIDRFEFSNGQFMTNADVNLVIQQMSNYANQQGISLTSLSDVQSNQSLLNIVASSMHS